MIFDALPPFDELAESSVIASMLVDPDAPAKVAPIVSARDFFREHNGWAFDACMSLWERGSSVDQVTLAHELEARGKLEEAGGLTYLSDLTNNLATPVGVEHWAAIVKRCALYRQLINAGMSIVTLGYGADDDYEKSLAKAETAVYALRNEVKTDAGFTLLRELLSTYMDMPERDETAPRALQTVRTGLQELDAILDGLKQGYLIVVAAQTSVGKTALMCNIATNAAVTQDARVAFFTLEMPEEQLARRILGAHARVETRKIERREYTDDELYRVVQSIGVLGAAEIYLYYLPGASVADLQRRCLELARDKGLDLVVIDYLGLMSPDKDFGTRNDQVGKITKELAKLAGLLDLPIMLGSQLRRIEGRRPNLNDLRDSGNIEQDATVVVFIHREEMQVLARGASEASKRATWLQEHPDVLTEPYPAGVAELIVAKNRNDAVGTALVRYRGRFTKFEDFELPAGVPVQAGIPEMYLNGNGVGAHA